MNSQNFTIQNIAYVFTILGVIAAVTVYILNSLAQKRQRRIDNIERYLKIHDQIFSAGSYPIRNVAAMENGTFTRDVNDKDMELSLNRFLGNIEKLALLQYACAIPKSANAYMIGWFAKHIYPILNDREKAERYWVVGVEFLRETMIEADKIDKMKIEELAKYIKNIC
jgi:hypothetical protein